MTRQDQSMPLMVAGQHVSVAGRLAYVHRTLAGAETVVDRDERPLERSPGENKISLVPSETSCGEEGFRTFVCSGNIRHASVRVPRGCKRYGCRCDACDTSVSRSMAEAHLHRYRAIQIRHPEYKLISCVLTVPGHLAHLLDTEPKLKAARQAARRVTRLLHAALGLGTDELLGMTELFHPAGEDGTWHPHFHLLIPAVAFDQAEGTRVVPIDAGAPSRLKELIREAWNMELVTLLRVPMPPPQVCVRVHLAKRVRYVLQREARNFPGWGHLDRGVRQVIGSGAFAPKIWTKFEAALGADPPEKERFVCEECAEPMVWWATLEVADREANLGLAGPLERKWHGFDRAREAGDATPCPADVATVYRDVAAYSATGVVQVRAAVRTRANYIEALTRHCYGQDKLTGSFDERRRARIPRQLADDASWFIGTWDRPETDDDAARREHYDAQKAIGDDLIARLDEAGLWVGLGQGSARARLRAHQCTFRVVDTDAGKVWLGHVMIDAGLGCYGPAGAPDAAPRGPLRPSRPPPQHVLSVAIPMPLGPPLHAMTAGPPPPRV